MAQMNDLRPIVGGRTSLFQLLSPVLQTAQTGAEGGACKPNTRAFEAMRRDDRHSRSPNYVAMIFFFVAVTNVSKSNIYFLNP